MRHGGNDDAYHLPEQEFQSGKKWQMVPVMLLSRQTGEFPPIQMRLCGEIFAQQPGARAGLFASGRQGQRGAAHMAVTIHFRVGDRVRLSKLGKSRTPKARAHNGTVVNLPRGGRAIEVLFDGNKQAPRVHFSYIEIDDEPKPGELRG